MREVWVDIINFEGRYQVSSRGRVRSLDRVDALGRSKPGVILTPWIDVKGRAHVGLAGKRFTVATLTLTAFNGSCPQGMECCHRNGNASDNRISNLRWGTRSSNTKDAVRHGTNACTRRTHCPQGHPLTEGNLVVWKWEKQGQRQCLKCQRQKSLESYYRRKIVA